MRAYDSISSPSNAVDLSPDVYARWRSSYLGAATDRIEQEAIFAAAGELKGRFVLDAGCGDGAFSLRAEARGARVVAVDISEAMLNAARRRALSGATAVEFLTASVEDLPFDVESFDVVFMLTVLCTVNNPSRAVREAYRVLKHGGRLVVGELGKYSLWVLKRRLSGLLGNSFWSSTRFWTVQELRELISQQGLELKSARGCVYYPPIGCAARILRPAEGLLSHMGTFGAAFLTIRADKV